MAAWDNTVVDVTCQTPLRSGVHVVLGIELDNMIAPRSNMTAPSSHG